MKPSLVVIGLGNPGNAYTHTRHNVGFQAVEMLAEQGNGCEWKQHPKFKSLYCEGRIVTFPVLYLKPETFMNLSGEAAAKVLNFYKLKPQQLLVLVDDIDLPLGTLRLRKKGGPGTHNGLRSLVEHIGDQFARIRIGVGPKPEGVDLSSWVLSMPPAEDRMVLEKSLEQLPQLFSEFVMSEKEDGDEIEE